MTLPSFIQLSTTKLTLILTPSSSISNGCLVLGFKTCVGFKNEFTGLSNPLTSQYLCSPNTIRLYILPDHGLLIRCAELQVATAQSILYALEIFSWFACYCWQNLRGKDFQNYILFLNLSGFSPLCVTKRLFKSFAGINDLLHSLHLRGFSPVCVSKCAKCKKTNKDASNLNKHLLCTYIPQ